MTLADLAQWTPIRLYGGHADPIVDWCHMGGLRYTEPFFEQTIANALQNPARLLFRPRTPISVLEALRQESPGVAPTGFIFHMSRCGSTLVSQMLATSQSNVVVSEAPAIDWILNSHHSPNPPSRELRIHWLRGLLSAMAQRRLGCESRFFVKFDSWHVLELPLILDAFPNVPWIFLYRDPVEVMVSQHRIRGTQMIPGIMNPLVFGIEPALSDEMDLDRYCARVLAKTCDAALQHLELSRGLLVNFSELPDVALGPLDRFFGAQFSPDEMQAMEAATHADAKNPGQKHERDAAAKQREATEAMRALAAEWISGPYERLESARLARTGATPPRS
jgi:hypothetical protein